MAFSDFTPEFVVLVKSDVRLVVVNLFVFGPFRQFTLCVVFVFGVTLNLVFNPFGIVRTFFQASVFCRCGTGFNAIFVARVAGEAKVGMCLVNDVTHHVEVCCQCA